MPEDVTLLFCDNNWGYIRRTAPKEEQGRKGGFGMYYHIDMNGGPWNDRWVNTSPLPKLREQLNLAYQSGIDRIWIINVGDLKPKELPIDFIMNYALDPGKIQPGDEKRWLVDWSAATFGEDVAEDIADILSKYPKYNLWRKPEVQVPGIFSVENYNEAERTDSLWVALEESVKRVKDRIKPEAQDAFYQLVYYPAIGSSGVARLYLAAEQNRHYARQNNPKANVYADKVKELFERDSLLTAYYNESLSNGKWRGMMQDNHIGYTMWSMPERNIMPEVRYVSGPVTDIQEGNLEVNNKNEGTGCNVSRNEYSIPAFKYSRKSGANGVNWIFLPDLGRKDGCMGIDCVTAKSASDNVPGPVLEYDITIPVASVNNAPDSTSGGNDSIKIAIGILPTQDINPAQGLRLGVKLDNGNIHILDARKGLVDTFDEYKPDNLKRSKKLKALPSPGKMALNGYGKPMRNEVFDNLRWLDVTLPVSRTAATSTSGEQHTLQLIMIDPEIVVEQLVINPDDSCYSYFGPPEK